MKSSKPLNHPAAPLPTSTTDIASLRSPFGQPAAGYLRFATVPVCRPAPRNLPTLRTTLSLLRSFVIRHSSFVIFPLLLTSSLSAEPPPPDPAAHTVIIPYDAKLPLNAQKAERFYLGYDDFQRLWKQAKENRRPLPAETDATQHAVIHSALYQARIEERGLILEARITATTRGEWTKLALPFAGIEEAQARTKALVGEVRVDGKAAALTDKQLTFEHPGTHIIELTATLPVSHTWTDLTLFLPPSLSGMLAVTTPKSDGWLRINNSPASTVEEQPAGRLFTQTLGAHREAHLQRSSRGLERGEGPVPAATVRGTLTLRELAAETLDAEVEFEFPGAVRRTLEFAVDEDLQIGALNLHTTLPGAGKVQVPLLTTQTRRENGRLIFTLTFQHEVSHGAVIRIEAAQRFLNTSGLRTFPLIQPLAQRVKQDIALQHDDSIKIKVNAGTAQRSAHPDGSGLQDAGRWQWTGPTAPTYDVQPAALFAEADVSYVFQLSEQKAELLAALTLKRKRGLWTRAVVGLPAGYEVQAVQGPALTAWQHEGSQLYLQLDPTIAGPEARLVVHLAKVAPQPVTSWTLEPLKLQNYEKVGGKALIVAHAANDVKLPELGQRADLKELDATVLDSVFAIAPPMEKKRALQHEGTAWTVEVALTRQAARFAAETMLLVLASDAGIRVSQQVVALVEQGALRQVSVRLPAALPEAVVSGPLLRETRSRIDGTERVYECSLQTEVLDRAELTFDLDLPLTTELDVPFVKVPDSSRLTRWFVLDNTSAREAKISTQTALEVVARDAVPYLPAGLTRPQFFRATGEGALKLAYQQLTSTEGTPALITLADLTTVLRADGTRWDIAQYSLINRSLQFLPVILPDKAELISVSVSGEPVRADEETQGGKRVRLIPLIHTRPGQRALEVKMIYRFAKGNGLQQTAKLDDPEIVGLSVERTTWTVWTPQDWTLKNFGGNMTATAAEGRELLQLEGMLSELGEANRALSSGKLEYGDAEIAYRSANALAQMVQEKKRALLSKTGRGTLSLPEAPPEIEMDSEVQQQQALLKGNWESNYAGRKTTTKSGKDASQLEKSKTAWGMNDAAPQEQQLRLAASNTFSGSVTTNGGQLFNDNVAVDNTYFANGRQVQQQAVAGKPQAPATNDVSAMPLAGGTLTLNGGVTLNAAKDYSGRPALTTGASETSGAITGNVAGIAGNFAGVTTPTTNTATLALGNSGSVSLSGGTTVTGNITAGNRSGGYTINNNNSIDNLLTTTPNTTAQTYSNGSSQTMTQNATGSVNIVNSNARSNNLGNNGTQVFTGQTVAGVVAGSSALQVTSATASNGAVLNSSGTQRLPGNGNALGAQFNSYAATTPAAPAPAMKSDPFGAPAASALIPPAMGADPFGAPAAVVDLPMSADAKRTAEPVSDGDGDDRALTLAQTVESLRPTGRRALGIELPLNGTAHHFSKLKDHAVLEIAIKRIGDPKTTSRLLCLAGGLLLWVGIGWKLKRRRATV